LIPEFRVHGRLTQAASLEAAWLSLTPKTVGVILPASTRFQNTTLNLHRFSVTFALGDDPDPS
jgi:hypothetical protein